MIIYKIIYIYIYSITYTNIYITYDYIDYNYFIRRFNYFITILKNIKSFKDCF